MAARFELFISCLPGLETWLAAEARALGLRARPQTGGVAAQADAAGMMRANLELGLASHVLVRVGRFRARSLGELRRKTAALRWRAFLRSDVGLEVRASSARSRLYHAGAIAQRVAEGVADAMGGLPASGAGDPRVVVVARFLRDECVLSLDTSGEPLHRRGWRRQLTRAVLREDLARALVLASGWDMLTPLVDPMAGSGTIPIEAAGLARRLPPGRARTFAFESTALFDASTWRDVRECAMGRVLDRTPAPVGAGDRDPKAVEILTANAARAGVAGDLEVVHASLGATPLLSPELLARGGAVVTDPPFWRRLRAGRRDPRALYQTLGRRLAESPGLRVALLCVERRLALCTGLTLRTACTTMHGGVRVRLMAGSV